MARYAIKILSKTVLKTLINKYNKNKRDHNKILPFSIIGLCVSIAQTRKIVPANKLERLVMINDVEMRAFFWFEFVRNRIIALLIPSVPSPKTNDDAEINEVARPIVLGSYNLEQIIQKTNPNPPSIPVDSMR